MRPPVAFVALGIALLSGVGIGLSAQDAVDEEPRAATVSSSPSPIAPASPIESFETPAFTPDPEPEEEIDPEPQADYKMKSCDLGGGNLNSLVGSTRVDNTGDVAVRVEVSFRWQLGDGSWVNANAKTVDLQPGREKLVFFDQKVSLNTALNFQDHPGYFNSKNCKTKAIIV